MAQKIQNSVITSLSALSVPNPLQDSYYYNDWVPYGVDNLYPNYVADLITISPTHQSVVSSKAGFINGDINIQSTSTILDLNNINGEGITFSEFIEETNSDLSTYESFYWEVIYNSTKTRIVAVNRLPYEHVRVGKYNEDGKIDTVYVSPDWSRKYTKKNKPRAMAVFNPKVIDTDSQVIIQRIKRPNQPYYTVPSYMSAVQYMLLEDDIAELNRNDVTNGFFPSMIMNFFNGEPTEDDKAELEGYINRKFTGKGSSKLMMFFSNDPERKVQMDTFTPPDMSRYVETMLPACEQKILTAHRSFPALMGVATGTGISNKADELEAQYNLYIKNVIKPLQLLMINALKKIYAFNGDNSADIEFINELLNRRDPEGQSNTMIKDPTTPLAKYNEDNITNPTNTEENA